jgi:predicted transcriptional regulator
MSSMRNARTISITLPPELLVKAQELARTEHRTISELFREALRHYLAQGSGADPAWDALLRRTRSSGKSLNIASEADVERLADEFRRDKNQTANS